MLIALPLVAVGCAEKNARADNEYVYQDDGCLFFNTDQLLLINQACKEATKKNKVTMLVFTCQYDSYSSKAAYTSAESAMSHFNVQADGDYCVVVVSKEAAGYHFYLDTIGRADLKVKQDEIDKIVYSTYGDLIAENTDPDKITAGVVGVVGMFGKAYSGKITGLPIWLAAVIGIVIGLIVMFVVAGRLKKSYSIRRPNATYSFSDNTRLDLQQFQDTFVRSTTTYTVISSSSSSSGGGGHSSSGGGGGGRGGR